MFVLDRAFRILLGAFILVVFGLIYPSWFCFLGLIPLITGVYEWCPLYFLAGAYKKNDTSKNAKQNSQNLAKKESKNSLFNYKKPKNEVQKNRNEKSKNEKAISKKNSKFFDKSTKKPSLLSKIFKKKDNSLFDNKPIFKD